MSTISLASKLSLTVRKLRNALGKTQAEFADQVGTTQRTVARWESEVPPSGTALAKLALIAALAGLEECAVVFRQGFAKELETSALPQELAEILGGRRSAPQPGLLSMVTDPVPKNAEETEILAAVLRILRNPEQYADASLQLMDGIQQARTDNKNETLKVQATIHLLQNGQTVEQVAAALTLPLAAVKRIAENLEPLSKTMRGVGGAK